MANETKVKFLKGQSSQLPAKNAATAGAFYLTDDTHRLYIGDDDGYLQELNQSITTIPNIEELYKLTTAKVSDGQFYYIEGSASTAGVTDTSARASNILVVAQGVRTDKPGYPNWVQVNPDSYYQLVQSTTAIKLTPSATSVAIGMTVDEESHGLTSGVPHKVTGIFTLESGSNVTFTTTTANNKIKIDSVNSTYNLKAVSNTAQGEINLGGSADDSIYFTGANNSGITVSSNSATKTVTINSTITAVPSMSFSNTGGLVTSISVNGKNAISSTAIYPTIRYGIAQNAKKTAVFGTKENNGAYVASLDIYTKDEIDTKITDQLSVAQALQYRGIASTAADLDTTTAKAGYTYKATTSIPVGSATAKTGDLIIAKKDNNDHIVWDIVPSGDDQFIEANVPNTATHFWSIKDNSLESKSIIAGSRLNAGKAISLTSSIDDNNVLSTTITHGSPLSGTAISASTAHTFSATSTSALAFPVVTSISKDEFGHITTATIATCTFQHASITAATMTYVEGDGYGLLGYSFKYGAQSTPVAGSIRLLSDTLQFTNDTTSTNSAMRAEIVWGSFGSNS